MASSLFLGCSSFTTALSVSFHSTASFHSLLLLSTNVFFGLFFLKSFSFLLPSSSVSWALVYCLLGNDFLPNSQLSLHLFSCLHRINSANGLEIKSTGSQSLLMVANVTEEHYGNYTCVAANKLGVTNASLYLYSKYWSGWREVQSALTRIRLCRKHIVTQTQESIHMPSSTPQTSSHELAFRRLWVHTCHET